MTPADKPCRRFRRFFPLLVIVMLLVKALVIMWLWNAIIPVITGFHAVTYWQALGLMILCRLLLGRGPFGGRPFKGGGDDLPPPARFLQMSDEEREKFREAWKKRGG